MTSLSNRVFHGTMLQCTGILLFGISSYHKDEKDRNIFIKLAVFIAAIPVVFNIVDKCVGETN
jgi:hypothetical protein